MTLSHIDDEPEDIGPFDSERDCFELSINTGRTDYRVRILLCSGSIVLTINFKVEN